MITGIIDVSKWEYLDLKGKVEPALTRFRDEDNGQLVICKATDGVPHLPHDPAVDISFQAFGEACYKLGLLYGGYHFGRKSAPGKEQAGHFLSVAGKVGLLALDHEVPPNPLSEMTDAQAIDFTEEVFRITGRYPLYYSGASFLHEHVKDPHDPRGKCPLWVAAYGPENPKVPSAWEHWDLFQFSDGTFGPVDEVKWPRHTKGFGAIDRNAYKGTKEDLKQWHANCGRPPLPAPIPVITHSP